MPLSESLPVLSDADVAQYRAELGTAGVRVLVGSVVDMGGVARAKSVPLRRIGEFHRSGMGASPTWGSFCVDNTIVFTERLGVVGDLRLRADLAAARAIGDGYAWAPAEVFGQDGEEWPGCARGRLRRVQAAAEAAGLTATVGHELEFTLTDAAGEPLPERRWQPYGLGTLLEHGGLAAELTDALEEAGAPVEQVHAEFGTGQFEVSLSPSAPLESADRVVLARLVIGRVVRAHGLLASFSPLPFGGGAGNGAHVHLSLERAGVPLLSGGQGPHGLTREGAAMLGGIVAGLPETVALLAGSVLSFARLVPGSWAGAYACWGLENREAAVRLVAATRGNPHGANVEVKCGDPAANVYLATAAVLGLAVRGVARGAELPPEVRVDPSTDPSAVRLPVDQGAALDALAASALARDIVGDDILDATLAVRRHEQTTYGELPVPALADRFRFAWTS
ncbi:glutamine synthetase family protein [Actinacidiphila sp. DG2A-62]|uniref:glutamine synthetase family protein n=1 Tax=Actinacidiphila sp. DG2A-62 TaxID=3108821 RepID=UPI002DC02819|nr:glutamine synthetase family protein [Actinacidiphila sp. DG2A-62]MEC3998240.1 glutamine synthetase family protein [Actinacidiphila sp. DG2A-62]